MEPSKIFLKIYNALSPTLRRGETNKYCLITDLNINLTIIIGVMSPDRNGYGWTIWKDATATNGSYWMFMCSESQVLTGSFAMYVYYHKINKVKS